MIQTQRLYLPKLVGGHFEANQTWRGAILCTLNIMQALLFPPTGNIEEQYDGCFLFSP